MTIHTDIIILLILILFFAKGWNSGLLKTCYGPASLVLGLSGAYFYYKNTSEVLLALAIALAAPLILKIFFALFHAFVIKSFSSKDQKQSSLSEVSRVLGAVISVVWGFFFCALALGAVSILPSKLPWIKNMQDHITTSISYNIADQISGRFLDRHKKGVDRLTRALENPRTLEKLQDSNSYNELAQHPKIQDLLSDTITLEQIQKRDVSSLLKNPKFYDLLNDEEVLKKIFALQEDAAKIPLEIQPTAATPAPQP